MQTETTTRSIRGTQVKPTREAIRAYWEILKSKADKGDVEAIAVILSQVGRQQ